MMRDADSGATFKPGSTVNSCVTCNEALPLCDGPFRMTGDSSAAFHEGQESETRKDALVSPDRRQLVTVTYPSTPSLPPQPSPQLSTHSTIHPSCHPSHPVQVKSKAAKPQHVAVWEAEAEPEPRLLPQSLRWTFKPPPAFRASVSLSVE